MNDRSDRSLAQSPLSHPARFDRGRRASRAWTGTALALASGVLSAAAIAAPPDNHWNSQLDYSYKLTGLTDFDQQRVLLNNPPNLPPGSMHCGPTSGMNMVAFIASHGFPAILPAGQSAFNWQDPANYVTATGHIHALAQPAYMQCGCAVPNFSGGTSVGGMIKGLRAAIGNKPITVSGYAPTGTFAPNLNQIAAAGLNNNLMSLAYGYYKVVGFTPGGYRMVVRQGGHFVTISGALRLNNICKLWVRDPADESQAPPLPNIFVESGFQDRQYHVDNGWVLVLQPPFAPQWRWMSRISPTANAPLPGLNGTFNLIDALVGARPRQALGINANGKLVLLEPGIGWLAGGGLAGDGFTCEEVDAPFTVLAADTAPDLNGAVIIAQDEGIRRGAATPDNVRLVDSATGEVTVIGDVEGAQHLTVGRNRAVYVVAGTTLHKLELPLGNEEEFPEGNPGGPMSIKLAHAGDALTYDDASDEVVLLNLADRKLMRVAADLTGDVEVLDLPDAIALGVKASVSINGVDGRIFIVSDGSSSVFGVEEPEKRGGEFEIETITLPEITAPTSVDFLGDGHMIVGQADTLIELEPIAETWEPVADSVWAGVECDVPIIIVDEDVTNFLPDQHETPEWDNIDPILIIPGNPEPDPLCFGDLNGDGMVDAADLGLVFAAWGFDPGNVADLDGNGTVEGGDMGLILAAWGPCT